MNEFTDLTANELATLMRNRASMYVLLARLYRQEPDDVLIEQLGAMDTSDQGTPEIMAGLAKLKICTAMRADCDLTELAIEFARIFLGTGGQDSAFPYESVYTSPERLMMQEARDDVLLQYRREGLDRATRFHEPEDHISLEFEFMAYLCQQAALAFENQDGAAASYHFEKQKNFLEQHLLRWVPEFCHDVTRLGRMEFYKAAAKITADFLLMEGEVIAGNVAHRDEVQT